MRSEHPIAKASTNVGTRTLTQTLRREEETTATRNSSLLSVGT